MQIYSKCILTSRILLCGVLFRKPDDSCSRKREVPIENVAPQNKRRRERTISEVEEIVKKLEEKHAKTYSVEKLNVWAHNYVA